MADIFISYARADREKIETLSTALEQQGLSVWWDTRIQSGAEFSKDIEAELDAAKAVIVCWSKAANESRWVKDEAGAGAEAGKLLTISIDGAIPPMGFRQFHCSDLSDWKGKPDEGVFRDFNKAVKARITGERPMPHPTIASNASWTDKLLKPIPLAITAVTAIAIVGAAIWLFAKPELATPVQDGLEMAGHDIGHRGADIDHAFSMIDPLSIAVLPFATRSNEDETAFFADGVHDDLLTTLANVTSLKVISRTSVLEYRDTKKNMRQIARELGAANILEGGIQAAGDNVRINVQLIDAKTDEHLWAKTYDRQLSAENIFAIQSEIVEMIAGQLAATLTPAQQRRIKTQPTIDIEAMKAFIRGKNSMAASSFQGLREAQEQFRHALELDPDYNAPRIAFAEASMRLARTGAITIEEAIDAGWGHIEQAVKQDPENGYAQAVLAIYKDKMGEPDAEETFKRALELNPNNVDALKIFSAYLRDNNRHEDALVVVKQALELDPISVVLFHDLGSSHIALGQFEEGRQAFLRISQINPDNPYAVHGAAQATILGGQIVEAGYWSDEAANMDQADYENPATSAFVYGSAGNMKMAAQKVEEALALGPDQPFPLAAQVFYFELTDQHDAALAIARRALAAALDDRWGSDWTFLRTIRNEALRSGDYGEALALYGQRIPEVFDAPPRIDSTNIGKAVDLAHLLISAGEQAEAQQILESVIARYDELYSVGSANWPLGPAKAQALALLNRPDAAIDELTRIFNDGWRMRWLWDTELNPSMDSIRRDPRYISLIAELKNDIEEQRKAFEASPLSDGIDTR